MYERRTVKIAIDANWDANFPVWFKKTCFKLYKPRFHAIKATCSFSIIQQHELLKIKHPLNI